jgi:hypothetical protein
MRAKSRCYKSVQKFPYKRRRPKLPLLLLTLPINKKSFKGILLSTEKYLSQKITTTFWIPLKKSPCSRPLSTNLMLLLSHPSVSSILSNITMALLKNIPPIHNVVNPLTTSSPHSALHVSRVSTTSPPHPPRMITSMLSINNAFNKTSWVWTMMTLSKKTMSNN